MYRHVFLARLSVVVIAGVWVAAPSLRIALAQDEGGVEEVDVVEEEEDEGPNQGKLSLTFNNDFTTAYFFLGILNERKGLIWQPSIDLALNVYEGDGALESVDVGFGIWNSLHSEETLADGSGPEIIYETDYYPSVSFTWNGGLTTTAIYYFYTSPNGAFGTVEEVSFELSYDDSELLGAFAMQPTATLAFETKNTSFGDDEGGSLELSGAPGLEVEMPADESGDYPIGISFPWVLGFSLYDYYEDDDGDDDTFGYASLGADVGVPLAFIPEDYGSWSVTAGLDVYFLADNLADANEDDEVYPVFTASVTMDY